MKALCFTEHGDLNVLRYTDVPDLKPGAGEVLARVRACALNHLDVWVRRGWPGLNLEMPHWGGSDMAGEIAAQGSGVSGWQVGQRVVVDPGVNTVVDEFTRRGEHSVSPGYKILGEDLRGGLAEYVVAPAANLVAMPAHVDFPAAAAPLLRAPFSWRMFGGRSLVSPANCGPWPPRSPGASSSGEPPS